MASRPRPRVAEGDHRPTEDWDALLAEAAVALRKLSNCPDLTPASREAFEKAGTLASVLQGGSPFRQVGA